jgi:hypothetical protein
VTWGERTTQIGAQAVLVMLIESQTTDQQSVVGRATAQRLVDEGLSEIEADSGFDADAWADYGRGMYRVMRAKGAL